MDFNFEAQGLTLIQGSTGSGKSTLCDIVPWILFGKTAKDGTVDEIKSWPGDEITTGTITLLLNDKMIQVYRARGKPKDNDLIIWQDGGAYRGKDMPDTQCLINNLLGIDSALYLAGAYFHEFSQTAQFFTTTAKNRRMICEQIVDLSLAQKLQPVLTLKRKDIQVKLDAILQQTRDLTFKTAEKKNSQTVEKTRAVNWDIQHNKTKIYALLSYEKFEANRKKVISKKCNSCGTILEHPREVVDTSINPYLSRVAELETETNPFNTELKDFSKEIKELENQLLNLTTEQNQYKLDIDDLDLLQEVIVDYRSVSIINTIQDIEAQTNSLLSKHFDGEIQVEFEVESADKIEVIIQKDNNKCSFSQLSKGQRCMLKLCFGVSIMKCVANHNGIKFHQLYFDEALDGLSEALKVRAFGLLEELSLEYDSIFCVEHSESLKPLFHNSYNVVLVNGNSQIERL